MTTLFGRAFYKNNMTPKRFEDEYPEAAAILMGFYREPCFPCDCGRSHYLPFRLRWDRFNVWKLPLHDPE